MQFSSTELRTLAAFMEKLVEFYRAGLTLRPDDMDERFIMINDKQVQIGYEGSEIAAYLS